MLFQCASTYVHARIYNIPVSARTRILDIFFINKKLMNMLF